MSIGKLHKHAKGAWAEIVAIKYLIEEGFDVFRAIRYTGPVDIIAIKKKEIFLIDVKLASLRKNKNKPKYNLVIRRIRSKKQIELGVYLMYISSDERVEFIPKLRYAKKITKSNPMFHYERR